MIDVILLRFDAPLMSFGGVITDNNGVGVTDRHPGLSMFTGLLGNALGYTHAQRDLLSALQGRLRIASRIDRRGEHLIDYQTVDLGQPHLCQPGWTTRGEPEGRAGSSSTKTGTHIRRREFLADSICTVALTLTGDDAPSLADLEQALQYPSRPLFLGRKPCIPSSPVFLERQTATSLLDALRTAASCGTRRADGAHVQARWPADEEPTQPGTPSMARDLRDWNRGVHLSSRGVVEGLIEVTHD